VPPDLSPANDLRFKGLEPRGGAVALLLDGDRAIELYRTADATPREPRGTPPEGKGPIGSAGSTGGRASRRSAVALPGASGLLTRLVHADADPEGQRAAALAWLRELLAGPFVILDTETTGIGYADEIVEIAIVESDGRVTVDTLVRPHAGVVPPLASRVHGLTMRQLQTAPTWADVYGQVLEATAGRRVVAWNAPFDERMVRQSARLWSLPQRLKGFECAMTAYASCRAARFGRAKLATAAAALGLLPSAGQRHRSREDALLTLDVLRRVAASPAVDR
jgi:DNA polymerase III subunit epsilon